MVLMPQKFAICFTLGCCFIIGSFFALKGPKNQLAHMFSKELNEENKLYKSSVMVTAGANQAFVNLVLTLCDAGDSVVMFAPYYFNAYMSFQMTGVTNILVGPGDPKTLHPDPG
ncbi:hypothetical protein IC575_028269 [Cucumis melo]